MLDSLAAGVPCVCTPIAAEGLALPPALDSCLARGPQGLAEAIVALHDDLAWNGRGAEAGLAHVAARYFGATLDAAMRRAVGVELGTTHGTVADPP